jgi:hypothetical protein
MLHDDFPRCAASGRAAMPTIPDVAVAVAQWATPR